jgi:phosphate uptake regulator
MYILSRVFSKDKITDVVLDAAMDFTQKAIGPEIIEENSQTIVIKDLLNPSKMPFEKTLERMYIIVRYMHNDTVNSMVNDIPNLVDDISFRDLEVDRLNWLMAHQYNVINSSHIPHSMNISKEKAEFYFVSGKIIERIGDHAVKIASNSKLADHGSRSQELNDAILKASNYSIDMFDKAINSWYNRDIKSANDNIEESNELEKLCDEIDQISLKTDHEVALAIGRIADSIRRTGDYSTDISENVINYLIRDL